MVFGFPFGYEGLPSRHGHKPVELMPKGVSRIHEQGGTVLGRLGGSGCFGDGRYPGANGIGILFTHWGRRDLRGAQAISQEIKRRGLNTAVIGIPKTIDNDISYIQQSFGFETAASEARRATYAATARLKVRETASGLSS